MASWGVGCAGDIDMKKGEGGPRPNLTSSRLSVPPAPGAETRARVFFSTRAGGALRRLKRGAAKGARHLIGVWIAPASAAPSSSTPPLPRLDRARG